MKLSALAILFLAVVLTTIPSLVAYSFGSGGCAAGVAGIGAPHGKATSPTLNTQVTTGTLAVGGFTVSIDGVALKPGVVTKVAIKKSHVLSVKAATTKFFRGFSFRLGAAVSSALLPLKTDVANTTPNFICPAFKAVGITHLNNKNKTSASGTLLMTTGATNVPLDVHIVVQNRNKKSIYYFSSYILTFA